MSNNNIICKEFKNEPIEKIPNKEDFYLISKGHYKSTFTYLEKLVLCSHDLDNALKIIEQVLPETDYETYILALSLACESHNELSHYTIIELLLNNFKGNRSINCKLVSEIFLELCSSTCTNIEVIKLLLNSELIDINYRDVFDNTALLHSCSFGSYEIVKLLLENPKVNVYCTNKNNFTPLACVYFYDSKDQIKKIKLLINDPRIDIYIFDYNGNKKTIFDLIDEDYWLDDNKQEKTNIIISKYPYCMHLATKYLDKSHINEIYDVIYTNICSLNTKKIQIVLSNIAKRLNEDQFYNLNERVYWRNYYSKNIVSRILDSHAKLYWKPKNIVALCKEIDYGMDFCGEGELFGKLDPKLKFLFDVKDCNDMMIKINYHID